MSKIDFSQLSSFHYHCVVYLCVCVCVCVCEMRGNMSLLMRMEFLILFGSAWTFLYSLHDDIKQIWIQVLWLFTLQARKSYLTS